jgi:hypothetical protein
MGTRIVFRFEDDHYFLPPGAEEVPVEIAGLPVRLTEALEAFGVHTFGDFADDGLEDFLVRHPRHRDGIKLLLAICQKIQ